MIIASKEEKNSQRSTTSFLMTFEELLRFSTVAKAKRSLHLTAGALLQSQVLLMTAGQSEVSKTYTNYLN